MKTILWTQNETPLIPDTIVVDGTICNDKVEKQTAFDLLNKVNQKLCLSPADKDTLYKRFKKIGYSHQANFCMLSPGVYIQGCFLEEDNVGRKLPYMYYDDGANNFEEASNNLISIAADTIGRNCNKKELKILEDLSKNKYKKKIYLLILTIIIVISIILIILKIEYGNV